MGTTILSFEDRVVIETLHTVKNKFNAHLNCLFSHFCIKIGLLKKKRRGSYGYKTD